MRVRLFDGPLTAGQQLILALWSALLAGVIGFWAVTSLELLLGGVSSALVSAGRLFGLLATFFALTQFMLMGRIVWIERSFGLDRLAGYHRINGYLAITFIIIHPILLISGYAIASGQNYFAQYIQVITTYPYAWLALIAQILFIGVVISSIYIVRKRLKFESWYYVHLMVYAAIALVPFHSLALGGSFAGYPLASAYWFFLYAFVAVNLAVWRFGLPFFDFFKYGFTVSRVVAETPTTTSVYISGRNLDRWKVRPGQFVLVRFFAPGFWWQEHPFSVSMLPAGDEFRLTIKNVGDYTSNIGSLKPGQRVLVSGPFGRFTRAVARTDKRLFLAGGVGITPIRTLAEEAADTGVDAVLLYGNRDEDDTILRSEIDQLSERGLKTTYVYSGNGGKPKGESGYVDIKLIERLVSDYHERDIYLCGPPAMMEGLVKDLTRKGVQTDRLHYEHFSLHN